MSCSTMSLVCQLISFFPDIHKLELFIALIIFVCIRSIRQEKRYGIPVWPIFGMLPSLIKALPTDIYEWVTHILSRQNWTFVFKGPGFGRINAVCTSDPRNIEYILKSNFSNFPKGKITHTNMRDLLGDGIFNTDGENWHSQRKTSSLNFHSAEFRKMTAESLNELVHSRLLLILDDFHKRRAPFDLQDVLLRLTFDNVCIIALGVDPGCLKLGLPEIPFAKAFEAATEATSFRFIAPMFVWKAMRCLNLGWERDLKKSLRQVHGFAENVILTRRKDLSTNFGNKKLSPDLLTVFTESKDDNGNPTSNKFLRDICINVILAGRDTSSVALSWFFWLLHKNPIVEERIYDEICHIVGKKDASDTEESRNCLIFGPEEIKRMEYLQAALSEALRLYPSVPIDYKEALEDDMLPSGTKVEKGMQVVYAIYAMGRMESIWGKDCREFKPERWFKNGKLTSESPYRFTAFNGGPRLCLGKDFAYYQMKFTAASIIYRYRVKVVEKHRVIPKVSLTLYMKFGLKVILSRRDELLSNDAAGTSSV